MAAPAATKLPLTAAVKKWLPDATEDRQKRFTIFLRHWVLLHRVWTQVWEDMKKTDAVIANYMATGACDFLTKFPSAASIGSSFWLTDWQSIDQQHLGTSPDSVLDTKYFVAPTAGANMADYQAMRHCLVVALNDFWTNQDRNLLDTCGKDHKMWLTEPFMVQLVACLSGAINSSNSSSSSSSDQQQGGDAKVTTVHVDVGHSSLSRQGNKRKRDAADEPQRRPANAVVQGVAASSHQPGVERKGTNMDQAPRIQLVSGQVGDEPSSSSSAAKRPRMNESVLPDWSAKDKEPLLIARRNVERAYLAERALSGFDKIGNPVGAGNPLRKLSLNPDESTPVPLSGILNDTSPFHKTLPSMTRATLVLLRDIDDKCVRVVLEEIAVQRQVYWSQRPVEQADDNDGKEEKKKQEKKKKRDKAPPTNAMECLLMACGLRTIRALPELADGGVKGPFKPRKQKQVKFDSVLGSRAAMGPRLSLWMASAAVVPPDTSNRVDDTDPCALLPAWRFQAPTARQPNWLRLQPLREATLEKRGEQARSADAIPFVLLSLAEFMAREARGLAESEHVQTYMQTTPDFRGKSHLMRRIAMVFGQGNVPASEDTMERMLVSAAEHIAVQRWVQQSSPRPPQQPLQAEGVAMTDEEDAVGPQQPAGDGKDAKGSSSSSSTAVPGPLVQEHRAVPILHVQMPVAWSIPLQRADERLHFGGALGRRDEDATIIRTPIWSEDQLAAASSDVMVVDWSVHPDQVQEPWLRKIVEGIRAWQAQQHRLLMDRILRGETGFCFPDAFLEDEQTTRSDGKPTWPTAPYLCIDGQIRSERHLDAIRRKQQSAPQAMDTSSDEVKLSVETQQAVRALAQELELTALKAQLRRAGLSDADAVVSDASLTQRLERVSGDVDAVRAAMGAGTTLENAARLLLQHRLDVRSASEAAEKEAKPLADAVDDEEKEAASKATNERPTHLRVMERLLQQAQEHGGVAKLMSPLLFERAVLLMLPNIVRVAVDRYVEMQLHDVVEQTQAMVREEKDAKRMANDVTVKRGDLLQKARQGENETGDFTREALAKLEDNPRIMLDWFKKAAEVLKQDASEWKHEYAFLWHGLNWKYWQLLPMETMRVAQTRAFFQSVFGVPTEKIEQAQGDREDVWKHWLGNRRGSAVHADGSLHEGKNPSFFGNEVHRASFVKWWLTAAWEPIATRWDAEVFQAVDGPMVEDEAYDAWVRQMHEYEQATSVQNVALMAKASHGNAVFPRIVCFDTRACRCRS
jgi:hypothetical protein